MISVSYCKTIKQLKYWLAGVAGIADNWQILFTNDKISWSKVAFSIEFVVFTFSSEIGQKYQIYQCWITTNALAQWYFYFTFSQHPLILLCYWNVRRLMPNQCCNEASKIFVLRRFLAEDPSLSSSSVHFKLSKNLRSFEDFKPKIPKIFGIKSLLVQEILKEN